MAVEQEDVREWIRLGVYLGIVAYSIWGMTDDSFYRARMYFYTMKCLNTFTCWSRGLEIKMLKKYYEEVQV